MARWAAASNQKPEATGIDREGQDQYGSKWHKKQNDLAYKRWLCIFPVPG